jgi:HD-GYP domain-containing protein (c-di-GMP phosphodiesterase class II)
MTLKLVTKQIGANYPSDGLNLTVESDVDHHIDPASPAARRMNRYAELTGLPFFCVDTRSGAVLGQPNGDALPFPPGEVLAQLTQFSTLDNVSLFEFESGLLLYVLPLPLVEGSLAAAVGYALSHGDAQPNDLVLAAIKENWSQAELKFWMSKLPCLSPVLLERMLKLAVDELEHRDLESTLQLEVEELTEQIEHTYEEISLLHNLTHNMQISRTPLELAEICVARIHDIIKSAANVIWTEGKDGSALFLVEGQLPFDEMGMARLIAHFEDHDWSRPLVKNNISGTLLGADFPGLDNLVVVSIAEGSHRSGWILSCNLPNGKEFGTVEANLLNSLATILGTHIRNIDLYAQHEDLLISFVRSLVSTLDARDPYTRGHSERVALIGRRLGEELDLPEEDLHDIYLSGLMHDVGKIGIDDRILRKPGKLTADEFRMIQQHPMIGYSILKGIKNLYKILPGVRNHHESYNGKGYPDGLAGDEIPLMARILAVADSYDAMGSDRPYRKGMPIEKIKEVFRRGSGDQWDSRVIDSYFAASGDIHRICESYSPTNGNLLETVASDSEFATVSTRPQGS